MKVSWFGLIVVGIAIVAGLAYSGTFYATGKQWYEGCYEYKVEGEKAGILSEAKTSNPYKAILWKNCEPTSRRGIFKAGHLLAGNPGYDRGAVALGDTCPSSWTDVPLDGTYILTLRLLQEQGGPSFFDRFLPAEEMVGRVYNKRWPYCTSKRESLGFPRIVETTPGNFDWETPCKRCATDTATQ